MKKRIIALLLVLVVTIGLLASCGNSGESSDSSAPVEITVAYNQIPNGLDPLTEDSSSTFSIAYLIYDRLVRFDPEGSDWIPNVAKSWERNSKTWTFEIDLSFKFSNGEQLTMDDVVYSLLRLRDVPKTADSGALIENVTYEGNTLTVVTTDDSNTTMPRILSTAIIVNKTHVEGGGDEAVFTNVIGTGPYVVTEFTPGASATVEAWDDYPFEKPQVDKINFIAIPDNSARYIALETGDVQFVGWITVNEYELAVENENITPLKLSSRSPRGLMFNTERAPFDNVNVRRALMHAFDRETVAALLGGRPAITSFLFVGFDDLYVESDNIPEFDLEKAKAMLEAEGFGESNPLTIDLYAPEAVNDPGIEVYQSSLKSIGVQLNINVLELSVYLAHEGSGDFDMIWVGQLSRGNTPLMDLDRVDANMIGVRNLSRYYNERVQEIVEEMRTTTDQQQLKALAVEINDIIATEVPMAPAYAVPIYAAWDKNLTGVVMERSLMPDFRNISYSG